MLGGQFQRVLRDDRGAGKRRKILPDIGVRHKLGPALRFILLNHYPIVI